MALTYFGGNEVRLLEGGEEFFPALLRAVRDSQHQILIDVYIFNESRIGSELLEALERAAERGVYVSLLIDGFGSIQTQSNLFRRLESLGAEVLFFQPIKFFPKLQNLFSERLHRKIFCFDAKTAFVTGMNIDDDYFFSHPKGRLDHAVFVKGPVVAEIEDILLDLRRSLRRHKIRWIRPIQRKRIPPLDHRHQLPLAAVVIRDNIRYRRQMEAHFLEIIQSANHTIDIASAYFFPGRRFLSELRRAAQRGVKVRLLLEGRAEFLSLYWATRHLYDRLFVSGVEIYEYHKSYLHSKFVSVDDKISSIGSCNFDTLSFFLNLEANISVRDDQFAQDLRSRFEGLLAGSKKICSDDFYRENYFKRLFYHCWYFIYRFLNGVVVGKY